MPSSPIDPRGSISRRDLTLKRQVWLTFALMFGLIAVCVAAITVLWPSFSAARLLPFAVALGVVAVVTAASDPPSIDSWRNHAAIVCIPVFTAIGIWVFAPTGAVPVAAAMFTGPFTAGRLLDRRLIFGHYAFATAVLAAPVLLLDVDQTTRLAVLSIIPGIWGLGVGCILVLEAGERQSEELSRIVRRDPLTGIGNRRLLTETFDVELPLHRAGECPLSVVTMDLNGFKQLNDTVGHDAGDALLQRVAATLHEEIGARGTVVRQGGDEFCLLLPMTTGDHAATIVASLRGKLAAEDDLGVTSGFGIATFPDDGSDADALLAVADGRLAADKITPRLVAGSGRKPFPLESAHPTLRLVGEEPVAFEPPPEQLAQHHVQQFLRLSRGEIAENRFVWRLVAGLIALYAVVTAVCYAASPDAGPVALTFAIGLGAVAVLALQSDPPSMHSWLNHVVIAVPYVGSVLSAFAMPDFAGVMIGALAFTGTLTAVRLVSRVAIVAHFALASLLILTVIAFAHLGLALDLSLALMVLVIWAMGFGDAVYLEAAEAQGTELEQLVRRDPLTGAGNRRLLGEQLAYEIRRHEHTHRSFTVIALDLNGFKALNDSVGHAAGDTLLCEVAECLQALARRDDTVIRQGGDEFCVILPNTDAAGALPMANAIRAAVAGLGTEAHPISTGAGMATFPAEASTGDVLLHVADERLRKDKASMAGLRRRTRKSGLASVRGLRPAR